LLSDYILCMNGLFTLSVLFAP